MDFLKKFADTSISKGEETTDKSAEPAADQSQSDLLSSAKLVAEAARSTVQKEPAKYENAKVAGAAADLLDAAQNYGKLDKSTGIGGYVEKAETYLHEYESAHGTKPKTEEKAAEPTKTKTEEKTAEPTEAKTEEVPSEVKKEEVTEEPKKEEEKVPVESTKAEETEIPSGVGEYAKVAEGFSKKNTEGESEGGKSDEGGLGGVAKLAGGFFK